MITNFNDYLNSDLTETEKDIMQELKLKNVNQNDLIYFSKEIDFNIEKPKNIAPEYNIKSSWANIAYIIGKKLREQQIRQGQIILS